MRVFKSVIVRLGVVGTAATGVVGLAAGTAGAYWLPTGSGTATAQAGTAQNPTTTAVAVTSGLLLPGGTGDVFIRVNNPNGYAVKVIAVTGAGTITASGGTGTCTNTALPFPHQSPTPGHTTAAHRSAT